MFTVNVWVTNGSTTLKAIVNPINAACEQGFVPDRLHILEILASPNRSIRRSISRRRRIVVVVLSTGLLVQLDSITTGETLMSTVLAVVSWLVLSVGAVLSCLKALSKLFASSL